MIVEYLQAASQDLLRQKLRTLLTMLGIIFGVGAVISMLSIGAGAQQRALSVIDAMGLRNVIVREKVLDDEDRYTIREKSLGLSRRDIEEVRSVVPQVVATSGKKRIDIDRVLSADARSGALAVGVEAAYFELVGLAARRGVLFDEADEAAYARVAVLGAQAARELFGYRDPLGEPIKLGDVWFTVIGVLAPQTLDEQGLEGVSVESADKSVFVPLSTALKNFDRKPLDAELDEIVFEIAPDEPVGRSAAVIAAVLRDLHGGENDFTVVVPEQLLEQSRQTRRIFNIVMGGIAGISLLVGGIGIMNIMLASVMERTREIGIRRAVGAKRRHIVAQFLSESVLISVLGGLVGVLLGFAIAWGVALFSDWSTVITGVSILLAFGFSVAVGIAFGTYPALRASRLDPIEALRTA
ncbi:MAG: ABC transporter permease [Acidobacteriota bacterium]